MQSLYDSLQALVKELDRLPNDHPQWAVSPLREDCVRALKARKEVTNDILMILRKVAEGDDYARLYKWVNPDALFVERVLREHHAAQQGVQLTALRRGLALSILFNVVLLAVVLATIGGN